MKIATSQLLQILPISAHSVSRFINESPDFPPPVQVGKGYYHDEDEIYQWLATRAGDGRHIKAGDKLLTVAGVARLTRRSTVWVWMNVTKNPAFSKVDLSPSRESLNPRRYFIEREIQAAFPDLIEVAGAAA